METHKTENFLRNQKKKKKSKAKPFFLVLETSRKKKIARAIIKNKIK